MLHPEQCFRPSIAEVLQHPFFSGSISLLRYNYIRQLQLREVFVRNNRGRLLEKPSLLSLEAFSFLRNFEDEPRKRTCDDQLTPRFRRNYLQRSCDLQQFFATDYLIDRSEDAQLCYLNQLTMLQNVALHLLHPVMNTLMSITPQMLLSIQQNFKQFGGSDSEDSHQNAQAPMQSFEVLKPMVDLSLFGDDEDLGDIFGAQAPLVQIDYGSETESTEADVKIPEEGANSLHNLLGNETNFNTNGLRKFSFDKFV